MMILSEAVAALQALQIPEERPNLSTNALLGVIAAHYGIVATSDSTADSNDSSSPSVDEPWWNYVLCCRDSLSRLCAALQPPEIDKPRLSLHQTALVKERLEFIVALGLWPHLDEGVGLPIASRLYSAEQFVPPRQGFHHARVRLIADLLMQLYDHAELRPALLPNFLHDLLVCLLTLSFAPQARADRALVNRYQARLRRVTTSGTPARREVLREVFVIQGAQRDAKSKLSQAPSWLRFACSQVLTKTIEKSPDGVLPVVLGFFDFAGQHGHEADKCAAIAQIVSRPPKGASGDALKDHWTLICGQMLPMLDRDSEPLVVRFAVSFINTFTDDHPAEAQTLLLDHIFGDVLKSLNSPDDDRREVISAERLRRLLQHLERFVSNSFEFGERLVDYLSQFIALAFYLAADRRASETIALNVASGLLMAMSEETASHRFVNLIFDRSASQTLCFHSDNNGEVSVRLWRALGPTPGPWNVEASATIDAAEKVLHRLPSVVQGRVFVHLLRRLRPLVTSASSHLPPDLLLSLLNLMVDKFPDCCISQPDQVVAVAAETLSRCCAVSEAAGDEATQMFMQESVSISLGLVSALLAAVTAGPEGSQTVLEDALRAAAPAVAEVAEQHPSEAVRRLALDLQVALATRGLVRLGTAERPPLVQEVEEETAAAIRDSASGVIPERGHALIVLARGVEERKEELVDSAERRQQLLQIFLDAAAHPDSFVYLPGVRGLSALAGLEPAALLPLLLDRFADASADADRETGCELAEARAEFRLRVGEALMRCVRQLGEAGVARHREALLNALLGRCRAEPRPMLRAAALSNLAEVCRLLRFSLRPCLHELLAAAGAMLGSDPAPEVRTAAAFLLLSLVRGVDRELWLVMDGEALRDLHRTLRARERVEGDEAVHRMLVLAINELDDVVRATLAPREGLVKEIRILR